MRLNCKAVKEYARTVRLNGPLSILLCFCIYILVFYLCCFFIIGEQGLLQQAAKVRPYAPMLAPGEAKESAGKLIFFFGDSTLLFGRESDGRGVTEMLEMDLETRYPNLGEVSVSMWAFRSANLFHYYCMMFKAMERSPDLIIVPINWVHYASEMSAAQGQPWQHKNRATFSQMLNMVPISEQFSLASGSLLGMSSVSPVKKLTYLADKYILCAIGAKLWFRGKMGLPEFKEKAPAESGARLISLFRGSEQSESVSGLYMFCPEHPFINFMRFVAQTAERRNIPLLFYLGPIPMERVRQDSDFGAELFECSAQLLVDAATTRTTSCVDFTDLLSDDQFADSIHFHAEGHRALAEALVPEVYRALES